MGHMLSMVEGRVSHHHTQSFHPTLARNPSIWGIRGVNCFALPSHALPDNDWQIIKDSRTMRIEGLKGNASLLLTQLPHPGDTSGTLVHISGELKAHGHK